MSTYNADRIKISSRARQIIQRDHRLFFTTTRQHYPLVVERGDGDFIYDIDGNRFIDFASFISVYNFGVNANRQIREAAKIQIDKIMHAAFTEYYAELPVKFAEELLELFPRGFGRVFLSNSGTEANEAAIKIARIKTERPYILSFYNAFHGRTAGSLALTASKLVQKKHLGPFNNVVHVPFPYHYRCHFGQGHSQEECADLCMDYIKQLPLKREVPPEEIAAIFIEPLQGEGGYIPATKRFVQLLREFATDNGILLVSDEVQAGYMRTGKFLAMDNFGVKADIYTMAKALGGGLPLGATVAKSSLGDLEESAHGTTFGGNMAAVAAAYASIRYLKNNRRSLEQQVKQKHEYIVARLEKLKRQYEIVGDIRGLGMMIGVEFVQSRKTKVPATVQRDQILESAFYNGLVLLPAGDSAIRIIPPITISMNSLEKGLDIFEKAVSMANK